MPGRFDFYFVCLVSNLFAICIAFLFRSLSFCFAISLFVLLVFVLRALDFPQRAGMFDFLFDVVSGRTSWRFKVRVARIWEVTGYVLVDVKIQLELKLMTNLERSYP